MTEETIPDDLEMEVNAWFFEYVEDVAYSDALRELIKILDSNEKTLWERIYEAEREEAKAQDTLEANEVKLDALETKLTTMERELEHTKEDLAAFKQH